MVEALKNEKPNVGSSELFRRCALSIHERTTIILISCGKKVQTVSLLVQTKLQDCVVYTYNLGQLWKITMNISNHKRHHTI